MSSVMRWVTGRIARASPSGQRSISARAASAHDPLEGAHALAVEGRQQQLALAHVGGVVEQQHRVVAEQRQQERFASPACSSRGSPVNTCLTASGWARKTQVPSLAIFTVNMSPWRRWRSSIMAQGRTSQRAVCTARGEEGPGGSVAVFTYRRVSETQASRLPSSPAWAATSAAKRSKSRA